jgi:hypothetical protein
LPTTAYTLHPRISATRSDLSGGRERIKLWDGECQFLINQSKQKNPNPISHLVNLDRVREQSRRCGISLKTELRSELLTLTPQRFGSRTPLGFHILSTIFYSLFLSHSPAGAYKKWKVASIPDWFPNRRSPRPSIYQYTPDSLPLSVFLALFIFTQTSNPASSARWTHKNSGTRSQHGNGLPC